MIKFYIWLHGSTFFNFSRYKKCIYGNARIPGISTELVGEMQMKETELKPVYSDNPKKNEISIMKIFMSREFWPPIGAPILLSPDEGRGILWPRERKVFICEKILKYTE
jgi:hypothetical protein